MIAKPKPKSKLYDPWEEIILHSNQTRNENRSDHRILSNPLILSIGWLGLDLASTREGQKLDLDLGLKKKQWAYVDEQHK